MKQVGYVWYVIAKLSKYVKISKGVSSDPFYRGFFKIEKGLGTSFQVTVLVGLFYINFYFKFTP